MMTFTRDFFILGALLFVVAPGSSAQDCPRITFDEDNLAHFLDYESNWWILRDVCVIDETIVVFDPATADGDPTKHNLPDIDLGGVQYQFRHVSEKKILQVARHGDHRNGSDAPAWATADPPKAGTIPEYYFLPVSLTLRYPSPQEAAEQPDFSPCTVPVLMYTHWPHNFGEFFIRPPAVVHRMQELTFLNRRMTYLMGLPAKLPMDSFNADLLRPLSDYEPTSFREFSRPLPPDTPSPHTVEGKATRCFERFIVGRLKGGSYPQVAVVAPTIASFYLAKGLPPGSPPSPWRDVGPDSLRVMIEARPESSVRQFLELDKLLQECNNAPPIPSPAGRQLKVQCVSYTFAAKGSSFAADIEVLSHVDALVAFHGAGEMNVLLAPKHTSIIEIRPREFGTTHRGWPNNWHPQVSRQSSWYTFFWCINVEDEEHSPASALELSGQSEGAVAARDRHVKLKWSFLRPVLEKVVQTDRDPVRYEEAVKNLEFVWQVEPGGVFGPAPEAIARDALSLLAGRFSALRRALGAVVPHSWLPAEAAESEGPSWRETMKQYQSQRPQQRDGFYRRILKTLHRA